MYIFSDYHKSWIVDTAPAQSIVIATILNKLGQSPRLTRKLNRR